MNNWHRFYAFGSGVFFMLAVSMIAVGDARLAAADTAWCLFLLWLSGRK